jgi:predicted RNA polymerase sigma factor
VTARRRAIDVVRREAHRDGKEAQAMALLPPPGEDEPPAVVADDLLRLVFTCCRPALALEAQVALKEYASTADGAARDACLDEATRLGRRLASLLPDEPTVLGLLALILLQDARRATRADAGGAPALLAEQDRSRWDRARIAECMRMLDAAVRHSPERPDPYTLPARIDAG